MRMNLLKHMLQAETAADKWWSGLSKKEQQAYIKAHPRSKYARGAGKASAPKAAKTTVGTDVAGIMSSLGYERSEGGIHHKYLPGNSDSIKDVGNSLRKAGFSYKGSRESGLGNNIKHYEHPEHGKVQVLHQSGTGPVKSITHLKKRLGPLSKRGSRKFTPSLYD